MTGWEKAQHERHIALTEACTEIRTALEHNAAPITLEHALSKVETVTLSVDLVTKMLYALYKLENP